MASARVLIVDDHEAVRKALRRLLTAEGYEVCGDAADGTEVIHAVRKHHPDLILIDLLMPTMSGIDAAREVLAEFPAMLIVLMTTPDPDILEAAHEAGIRATVSKGSGNFVSALDEVLRSESRHQ